MKSTSAYYAHSMRKYNSGAEADEFAFILDHFNGNVICPNKHLGELGSIELYLKVIGTTSVVYASEYMNYVGRGVFDECAFALSENIPVFVVRQDANNNYYLSYLLDIEKTELPTLTFYGRLITE